MTAAFITGQEDNPLVGAWVLDQGFQTVELVFRSDCRYQLRPTGSDPVLDSASNESGRYKLEEQTLTLTPYDYMGEPLGRRYAVQIDGSTLTLTSIELEFSLVYEFKSGSRADVLAREQVTPDVVRTWWRSIPYHGREELTFRPDGYYFVKDMPEGFAPRYIRGEYRQQAKQLSIKPYSGIEVHYELDFFGGELTLITAGEFHGEWTTYAEIPGSAKVVRAETGYARAFLNREDWQVGVWEIRETDPLRRIDLTLRPDGHFIARQEAAAYGGVVRGRYTLESRRIHFQPFIGQGIYSGNRSGEFGQADHTRAIDYYDSELQLIDRGAISQSVTLARKRAGSKGSVQKKAAQAQSERAREGWHVGVWMVRDPSGWMDFTLRPDGRYIARSGADGLPNEVERGRYVVGTNKVTLAPYANLGPPRGFELDLYDGDMFLVGDMRRMVVARKVSGSEASVVDNTRNPRAMQGERGSILGLWTANLPGAAAELVFRPDGEFRLRRCSSNVVSNDYGLFAADVSSLSLVSDSRFVDTQSLGLDFYGDTLTIHGGTLGPPRTYVVNLGQVDAAIQASLAADAAEAEVDAQWLARVPIGPRDPNAIHLPTADVPADPNPGGVFDGATVFTGFQFYRWLIFGYVYFYVWGSVRTVPVVNSREWYFFPGGRTLVRFRNHVAGASYPTTVAQVSDSWGAYRIEPSPDARDILHRYADNMLFIESDSGELVEMTLEDGRRHLFWGKDYQILLEWATEQRPVPCQPPANPDSSLMNSGVSLTTTIAPDVV